MDTNTNGQTAAMPIAEDLRLGDLANSVLAGWRDFRAKPLFGIFLSGILLILALLMIGALDKRGDLVWLIPAMAGLPILAPFAAAGLYEVSRRLENGEPLTWKPVLLAVRGRGDDQLPVLGIIAFVFFAFWVIIAHTIFGVFLGQSGLGADPMVALTSGPGLAMLTVGSIAGAILAFIFFSMTVISMPMLVDLEADFISAIIVSFRVVRANMAVMLVWALLVALMLFAAMLPLFAGLLVALPILGHATWHLYRRATTV